MPDQKQLMLVTVKSDRSLPDQAGWLSVFETAGRPIDKAVEVIDNPPLLKSTINLTEKGATCLRTAAQQPFPAKALYEAQLATEADHDVLYDIVVVVDAPSFEDDIGTMAVALQLTAAGHRVHSLEGSNAVRASERLAGRLSAAGFWSCYNRRTIERAVSQLLEFIAEPKPRQSPS